MCGREGGMSRSLGLPLWQASAVVTSRKRVCVSRKLLHWSQLCLGEEAGCGASSWLRTAPRASWCFSRASGPVSSPSAWLEPVCWTASDHLSHGKLLWYGGTG